MAESWVQPFANQEWIFEMKWDGYQPLAKITPGPVDLLSRKGLICNT
jgi:ATP-dependent DNA ligase